MLAFSGFSKINWVFQTFNLVLFTSKLNIIGITVHNFKQWRHDNSKFSGLSICVPNGNTGNERVNISNYPNFQKWAIDRLKTDKWQLLCPFVFN